MPCERGAASGSGRRARPTTPNTDDSLNDYDYAGQDPVNDYDLNGTMHGEGNICGSLTGKALERCAIKRWPALGGACVAGNGTNLSRTKFCKAVLAFWYHPNTRTPEWLKKAFHGGEFIYHLVACAFQAYKTGTPGPACNQF